MTDASPHVGEDPAVQAELRRRGIDVEALLRSAAHGQDDETEGFARLAERSGVPRLERAGWVCRYPGADGLGCWDHVRRNLRLIHSIARADDGEVWAHLSLSRRDRVMPTWEQTRDAWWLVYDQVPGVIVVAPASEHVDIAEVGHIWGCLTKRVVPDFTGGTGSIQVPATSQPDIRGSIIKTWPRSSWAAPGVSVRTWSSASAAGATVASSAPTARAARTSRPITPRPHNLAPGAVGTV